MSLSTNSGSWWWTRKPGVLQSMGSQRVRHDWKTELNWTEMWMEDSYIYFLFILSVVLSSFRISLLSKNAESSSIWECLRFSSFLKSIFTGQTSESQSFFKYMKNVMLLPMASWSWQKIYSHTHSFLWWVRCHFSLTGFKISPRSLFSISLTMMRIAKDVLSFIGLSSLSFLNLWICFFYKISNILIHCFFRSFFFPTLLPLLGRQRHKWYTSSVIAHTSLSLCSIYFLFSIYLLSGSDWEEHGWQLPLFLAELFRRLVSLPQTYEEKQGRFNPLRLGHLLY